MCRSLRCWVLFSFLILFSKVCFAQLGAAAIAQLKRSGQYDSLRAAFLAAEHQVKADGDGFLMQNPEQNFESAFHDGAITAQSADGNFGLRLVAYGYGKHLQSPPLASVHTDGPRIEYRRGPLTEWYVNDARGLEQGFTVSQRRAHPEEDSLVIELAVSGTLQPSIEGDHIALQREGRTVLLYTGLKATDATGRKLNAHMSFKRHRIRIEVMEAHTLYPISVDPWIQQQELTASNGTSQQYFGTSISLSGDTVLIGGASRSYIFVRSGSTWTQQTQLSLNGYRASLSADTAI